MQSTVIELNKYENIIDNDVVIFETQNLQQLDNNKMISTAQTDVEQHLQTNDTEEIILFEKEDKLDKFIKIKEVQLKEKIHDTNENIIISQIDHLEQVVPIHSKKLPDTCVSNSKIIPNQSLQIEMIETMSNVVELMKADTQSINIKTQTDLKVLEPLEITEITESEKEKQMIAPESINMAESKILLSEERPIVTTEIIPQEISDNFHPSTNIPTANISENYNPQNSIIYEEIIIADKEANLITKESPTSHNADVTVTDVNAKSVNISELTCLESGEIFNNEPKILSTAHILQEPSNEMTTNAPLILDSFSENIDEINLKNISKDANITITLAKDTVETNETIVITTETELNTKPLPKDEHANINSYYNKEINVEESFVLESEENLKNLKMTSATAKSLQPLFESVNTEQSIILESEKEYDKKLIIPSATPDISLLGYASINVSDINTLEHENILLNEKLPNGSVIEGTTLLFETYQEEQVIINESESILPEKSKPDETFANIELSSNRVAQVNEIIPEEKELQKLLDDQQHTELALINQTPNISVHGLENIILETETEFKPNIKPKLQNIGIDILYTEAIQVSESKLCDNEENLKSIDQTPHMQASSIHSEQQYIDMYEIKPIEQEIIMLDKSPIKTSIAETSTIEIDSIVISETEILEKETESEHTLNVKSSEIKPSFVPHESLLTEETKSYETEDVLNEKVNISSHVKVTYNEETELQLTSPFVLESEKKYISDTMPISMQGNIVHSVNETIETQQPFLIESEKILNKFTINEMNAKSNIIENSTVQLSDVNILESEMPFLQEALPKTFECTFTQDVNESIQTTENVVIESNVPQTHEEPTKISSAHEIIPEIKSIEVAQNLIFESEKSMTEMKQPKLTEAIIDHTTHDSIQTQIIHIVESESDLIEKSDLKSTTAGVVINEMNTIEYVANTILENEIPRSDEFSIPKQSQVTVIHSLHESYQTYEPNLSDNNLNENDNKPKPKTSQATLTVSQLSDVLETHIETVLENENILKEFILPHETTSTVNQDVNECILTEEANVIEPDVASVDNPYIKEANAHVIVPETIVTENISDIVLEKEKELLEKIKPNETNANLIVSEIPSIETFIDTILEKEKDNLDKIKQSESLATIDILDNQGIELISDTIYEKECEFEEKLKPKQSLASLILSQVTSVETSTDTVYEKEGSSIDKIPHMQLNAAVNVSEIAGIETISDTIYEKEKDLLETVKPKESTANIIISEVSSIETVIDTILEKENTDIEKRIQPNTSAAINILETSSVEVTNEIVLEKESDFTQQKRIEEMSGKLMISEISGIETLSDIILEKEDLLPEHITAQESHVNVSQLPFNYIETQQTDIFDSTKTHIDTLTNKQTISVNVNEASSLDVSYEIIFDSENILPIQIKPKDAQAYDTLTVNEHVQYEENQIVEPDISNITNKKIDEQTANQHVLESVSLESIEQIILENENKLSEPKQLEPTNITIKHDINRGVDITEINIVEPHNEFNSVNDTKINEVVLTQSTIESYETREIVLYETDDTFINKPEDNILKANITISEIQLPEIEEQYAFDIEKEFDDTQQIDLKAIKPTQQTMIAVEAEYQTTIENEIILEDEIPKIEFSKYSHDLQEGLQVNAPQIVDSETYIQPLNIKSENVVISHVLQTSVYNQEQQIVEFVQQIDEPLTDKNKMIKKAKIAQSELESISTLEVETVETINEIKEILNPDVKQASSIYLENTVLETQQQVPIESMISIEDQEIPKEQNINIKHNVNHSIETQDVILYEKQENVSYDLKYAQKEANKIVVENHGIETFEQEILLNEIPNNDIIKALSIDELSHTTEEPHAERPEIKDKPEIAVLNEIEPIGKYTVISLYAEYYIKSRAQVLVG